MKDRSITASDLRLWREAAGLTLREVGDLAGLSPSMVSRLERGERCLSPRAKVEFARAVGEPVRVLFPYEGDAS